MQTLSAPSPRFGRVLHTPPPLGCQNLRPWLVSVATGPACSTFTNSRRRKSLGFLNILTLVTGRHLSGCRAVGQQGTSRSSTAPEEDEYMKEYRELKDGILDRTRKTAALVALYLLVTVDGKASLCALLGSLFAGAYLLWLFHDIDSVKPTDRIPLLEAEKISLSSLRAPAKLLAAWRQALPPRLLVPVGLACLVGGFGAVSGEPLSLTYDGCLLLGFLSYKVALLMLMAPDEKTKKREEEVASRPIIERIDDELDMWGRPKNRTPLPTAALPEGVDVSSIRVPPSLLGLEGDDLIAAEAAAAAEQQDRLRRQQQTQRVQEQEQQRG